MAKNAVKKENRKVVANAVENYFSLENMPKRELAPYDGESDYRSFANSEEDDIKAYFGEAKYNEYKLNKEKGTLPGSDKYKVHLDQSQKMQQKLAMESVINDMPEEERGEAILLLPDIIDDEAKEIVIEGKTYENPQELYNYMIKKSPEKAMRFQQEYLSQVNKDYTSEVKNYNKEIKAFETENSELFTEQAKISEDFKKLGHVTEKSSPEEIKAYNDLYYQQEDLNLRLKEKGVDEKSKSFSSAQVSLREKFDDIMNKSKTFSNSSMAATALSLDYSLSGRISLQMEKSFIAGGAVLGRGGLKLIGKAQQALKSQAVREVGEPVFSEEDKAYYARLDKNYQNAINYYDEVGDEIQTKLPTTIKADDITMSNVFRAGKQMLGNNSPSILVALGTGGLTGFGSAGLSMAARKKVANLGMATFFQMEAGGKLGDMEVAQKYATENIASLEKMLLNPDLTPDQVIGYKKAIEENENALSFTGFDKAFSSIMYGGIAAYAERLGTLSYVSGLNKASKAVGGGFMKKALYGAKGSVFNMGVELAEETVTTLGHNLIDIVALNEDKSLIEGLDKDFVVNTLFTSLAIQGPSMGMSSYNVLKGEVNTMKERSDSRARQKELFEITDMLKDGGIVNQKQRKLLVDRKREILEEAALEDVMTVQKVARMSNKEVTDLFESNRLRRKALNELQELGSIGDAQDPFVKKQKEKLINDYNKHDSAREFLLAANSRRNEKMMKEFAKKNNLEIGVDIDPANTAEMYYNLGKFQFNEDILKNVVKEGNVKVFEGDSAVKDLESYLTEKVSEGKISEADKADALSGKKNAMNIGGEIVLMKDNIHEGIMAGGAAGLFAAEAPLHEILHIELKKAGIVTKGDKIAKDSLQAVQSIQKSLNDKIANGLISGKVAKMLQKRIDQYTNPANKEVNLEEMITLVGDLKSAGVISKETQDINYDLKRFFKGLAGKALGDKTLFLDFKTIDDIFRYVDSFQKQAKTNTLVLPTEEDKNVKVKDSKAVDYSKLTPEQLVKVIKRGKNPQRVKEAYEALTPQFDLLALKALNYDTRKGDIDRDSVIAEARKFLPGIVDRFKAGDSKFSTFVTANMRPKQQQIYEATKTLQDRTSKKLDSPDVQELAGDVNETTNTQETFVEKINILSFATVAAVADKIKALVKVKPGDTFKQIIQNYAGKVGELVFDIPAKKIMEGGANLTAVTKYTEGMPAPAEAQSIQRFFNAASNAERFIKTLPPTNVTSKTADINKIGENIDVSRNAYGVAIGLKGLPLSYLYEKTGKRSQGLTSQTPVFKLKDKFKNPTPEVIEQFKKDIGITPKGEQNVYSRDIGQLLKGAAKVYSINAALSAAQRVQEVKTEAAPAAEKQAIKQQTADITAAQSKIAFSESVLGQFNLEVNLDDLLQEKTGRKTHKLNTKTQIDAYIKDLKKHVLPLMPRDFWFGQPSFISTTEIRKELDRFGDKFYDMYNLDVKTAKPKLNKVLKELKNTETALSKTKPNSAKRKALNQKKKDLNKSLKKSIRELDVKTWGTEFTPGVRSKAKNYEVYQTYYKPEMQKLRNLPESAFGKEVDGVKDFSRQSYGSIFKNAKTIEVNIKNGKVKEFNDKVGKIHKALWDRINDTIKKDKSSAATISNYLKLTASQSNHWHKLGAAFVGYSPKPAGKTKGGVLVAYEYEHAMPATAAYIFLLDAALNKGVNFNETYKLVMDNYKLIALDSAENAKLGLAKLGTTMPKNWNLLFDDWYDRYFNIEVAKHNGGIDPSLILDLDGKTFAEKFNVANVGKIIKENQLVEKKIEQGLIISSKVKASQGITILDFDDTLATSKSLVKYTKPDGTTGTLNAEQYASTYENLLDLGYVFDFSEFNKVVDGKIAPLFQKALKLQNKFGSQSMFVLTARPPQAQQAIFDFLTANGLNIPLENITGLANSTSEAKALWVAEKVSLGFNDFYFADDALQNVQAVKNVLDQFDVKSKIQQARVKFSEGIDVKINEIIEQNEDIGAEKVFSKAEAQLRGAKKGKMKFYIPPGAEDFMGLIYTIANARGKKGEAQVKFFVDNLLMPYQKGVRKINSAKQAVQEDYKALLKEFPDVKSRLRETIPGMNFTIDAAVRVYLWDKAGFDIPDISKSAKDKILKYIKQDQRLIAFADTVGLISKRKKGYTKPETDWVAQTILSDLDVATNMVGRKEYLNEFIENVDLVFNQDNLNKLEAIYGTDFVEALKDMIFRMKTGKNRNSGQTDKQVSRWTTWISNSVGAIMFLNMRSALLQTISAVNFVNWSDNNPVKAAAALANLPQFAKDFSFLFNSDYLKQRRSGLRTDVNEAELANSMAGKKNKANAILAYLLKKGFTPTQIADSFAIASGGATFYRNRLNTYLKQGMDKKAAEEKAFADFQSVAEVSQQSADPSLISKQQASILGRFILAFQNTPMQYARITKKAAIDLIKGRGDWKTNVSKIVYYAAIQNIIFSALQSALFALAFDDKDEDEKDKKIERLTNTVIDSLLRGTGIYGAVVATAKNIMLEFWKQDNKGYRADHAYTILQFANISPPIGSKLRKLYSATQTRKFNKRAMEKMGYTFNNPVVPAIGLAVEAFTNVPLGRAITKINNAKAAVGEDVEMWQRMALIMGWNTWDLGVEDPNNIKKFNKKKKSNVGGIFNKKKKGNVGSIFN